MGKRDTLRSPNNDRRAVRQTVRGGGYGGVYSGEYDEEDEERGKGEEELSLIHI